MTDLEQQLRMTLDEKGESALGAPPTRVPDVLRRRMRRRQAANLALTAVVAGVVLAGSAFMIAEYVPEPAPVRPIDRPTPDLLPASPDVEVVLGSGRTGGEPWELVVSHGADGWCLGVRTGAGSGFGCPYEGDVAVDVGGHTVTGFPKFVYGALSSYVARIEASTLRGDPLRPRVFEVPKHLKAPFDRAFVVVADRGLVLVTAYDRDGGIIRSAGA